MPSAWVKSLETVRICNELSSFPYVPVIDRLPFSSEFTLFACTVKMDLDSKYFSISASTTLVLLVEGTAEILQKVLPPSVCRLGSKLLLWSRYCLQNLASPVHSCPRVHGFFTLQLYVQQPTVPSGQQLPWYPLRQFCSRVLPLRNPPV